MVMTRRQTPLRDFAAVQTSIDELTSDIRPFRGIYEGTECVSSILGIVKQRLATAIDTREESQQLGIIRLTFALDRILNRERDFRFFSGNLTLGHSRIGR